MAISPRYLNRSPISAIVNHIHCIQHTAAYGSGVGVHNADEGNQPLQGGGVVILFQYRTANASHSGGIGEEVYLFGQT